ncbi:FAD-binding oxidoreductase [Flavobacterium sp. K77]|uniref:NAD(P)/FAD-dependent oxidoreductase n=1 Tax=Flavobacterium sp. K77 TaxID=2910676 RepID=UPI001F3128F2|nr:FAD-binding oxidoreductase [Flavobacterium sp. K77]MCF6140301.1 FAD-binding oxidoreductase [Flavobacterium sp. K77]
MIDYLIVGAGLGGLSFAEWALENDKTICVVDNNSQNSSRVAGGLYNPVILKRFSEVWNAKEQLEQMNAFYNRIEKRLSFQFDFKKPILRKFFSVEEQNNWFTASDKVNLAPFLSTTLIHDTFIGIESPHGYGQVLHTGYVDTALLLQEFRAFLSASGQYEEFDFEYDALELITGGVRYKGIIAKHVIFAEGYGLHANPYFNSLPLDGTKGELFIIEAPGLQLDVIVNTSVFILPLGENLFKVGATYNWKDKTNDTSEEGKQELIDRIQEIINCDFKIISHFAGIRPTVRDRRPLIGTHQIHPQLHVLNGLGTRGVMLGPSMAKALYDFIEFENALDPSIDCWRFEKRKK